MDSIYEIFPSIGVARVGNAPEQFYIGPESASALPTLSDTEARGFTAADFRDSEGRLCRQAARFRIYRSEPDRAPEEVTLDSAGISEIRWRVHLANKKAGWYRFLTSKGRHGYAPNHPLRNAARQTIDQRRQLLIDPGPRGISGRNAGAKPSPVEFSRETIPAGYKGGMFPPAQLRPEAIETLGALLTDGLGRLLVLGGLGRSGSVAAFPALDDYANNDGWWDDTADGPVRATIRFADGQVIHVKPAWVVVGPPAYAPQIGNLVTLYDAMFDTAVRQLNARPEIYAQGLWQVGPAGYHPHFDTEIKPIFERAATYPWVVAIPPKPHRFDYERLANPLPSLNGLRKFYLDVIRGPGDENAILNHAGATLMPYLAGDDALDAELDVGAAEATSKYLRLTEAQYFFLQQWAEGYFESGGNPELHPGKVLTRAVLENCVGGAFSPGIEMPWVMCNPAIYDEPFRLRHRWPIPDPLSLGFEPTIGLEPGDITRYMALPWQADFNECSSQPVQGRVMWWWPAQRPAFVYLPDDGTSTASSPTRGLADGLGPQLPWIGSDHDQNAPDFAAFADNLEMLRDWHKLGFVFNIGKPADPRFVEVARTLPRRQRRSSKI